MLRRIIARSLTRTLTKTKQRLVVGRDPASRPQLASSARLGGKQLFSSHHQAAPVAPTVKASDWWSERIPFESPPNQDDESMFVAGATSSDPSSSHIVNKKNNHDDYNNNNRPLAKAWSQSLSFASPESDFVAASSSSARFSKTTNTSSSNVRPILGATTEKASSSSSSSPQTEQAWSKAIPFTSILRHADDPSDFTTTYDPVLSSPESALGTIHIAELLDEQTKNKIQASQNGTVDGKEEYVEIRRASTASFSPPKQENKWSEAISFVHAATLEPSELATVCSSPESAFGAVHIAELLDKKTRNELQSLAAVVATESSVSAQSGNRSKKEDNFATLFSSTGTKDNKEDEKDTLLSFQGTEEQFFLSSPASALGNIHVGEMLDETTKHELLSLKMTATNKKARNKKKQTIVSSTSPPTATMLPQTMSEILKDPRPIVVTSQSSPFNIVQVNDAWVGLCGYSREEAAGQNLGQLLQGPDTSNKVAMDMISQLKRDNYSEAILTNYTKTGRKFQNHVKVGRIKTFISMTSNDNDDDNSNNTSKRGATEYVLVGILQEIRNEQEKKEAVAGLQRMAN